MEKSHSEFSKRKYSLDKDLALKRFFESAPMMMGIVDVEGDEIRHVSDNHAACEFFGLPVDSMDGKLSSEMGVPEDTIAFWIEKYRKAEATGRPVSFEYKHDNKCFSVSVSFLEKTAEDFSRFSFIVQDLTQARANESELRNLKQSTEQAYKLVVSGMKDYAIITMDVRGTIIDWNNGAEALFQWKKEEVMGKNASLIFLPEERALHVPEAEMLTALSSGNADDIRWHIRKDGTKFFANGALNLITNDDGTPYCLVKILQDKTEKKISDDAFQDIYRFFLQAPIAMVILEGPDYEYLLANDSYEKLVGTKATGRKLREVFTKGEADLFLPLLDHVFITGEPFNGNAMPFKDKYINIRFQKFTNLFGNKDGVFGIAQDVTELVVTKNKFEELANSLPQIIWVARPDGFVYWYNDKWYEYTGLPRETSWDDVNLSPIHPDEREELKSKWVHSLQTGIPTSIEFRIKRKIDGMYRWHLSRGLPIRDTDGVIIKWIGSNTDIHEQKILVSQLETERDLRDQFVTALTHDLRTPLTAAKMSAQIITRRPQDIDLVNKSAVRIVDNMNRADSMIRDLLDANRIKAGEKIPIDIGHCNITKVISEAVDDLSTLHGDRFNFDHEIDIEGQWSCTGIRRIIDNLCNNAIKYGSPHERIRVSLYDDKDDVYIEVHNKGNPISEEDQAKLFQPFSRSQSAQESSQKGWGIGLTLVKGIVEAQDGTVWVESHPQEGTTFMIRLPKIQDSRKKSN